MDISEIKYNLRILFNNYNYHLYNTYIYEWESDFFAISKSGYSIEVEIKTSRSDFKADFKKTIGFSSILKHSYLNDNTVASKPCKYFFACPEGLIKPDEIDKKYGLIYIYNYNSSIIKNAKFLHKNLILSDKYYLKKLLNKFYYRTIDLRAELGLRDERIKYGQKVINYHEFY